jgi:hypothetical protein
MRPEAPVSAAAARLHLDAAQREWQEGKLDEAERELLVAIELYEGMGLGRDAMSAAAALGRLQLERGYLTQGLALLWSAFAYLAANDLDEDAAEAHASLMRAVVIATTAGIREGGEARLESTAALRALQSEAAEAGVVELDALLGALLSLMELGPDQAPAIALAVPDDYRPVWDALLRRL